MAQQDRVLGREARGPITAERLDVVPWGFRDDGISAEDLAATLLKNLVGAWDPREMTVDLTQQVRGGLKIRHAKRLMGGR